jgi:hypothetical protein
MLGLGLGLGPGLRPCATVMGAAGAVPDPGSRLLPPTHLSPAGSAALTHALQG